MIPLNRGERNLEEYVSVRKLRLRKLHDLQKVMLLVRDSLKSLLNFQPWVLSLHTQQTSVDYII